MGTSLQKQHKLKTYEEAAQKTEVNCLVNAEDKDRRVEKEGLAKLAMAGIMEEEERIPRAEEATAHKAEVEHMEEEAEEEARRFEKERQTRKNVSAAMKEDYERVRREE